MWIGGLLLCGIGFHRNLSMNKAFYRVFLDCLESGMNALELGT